jgi:hypothetical protein
MDLRLVGGSFVWSNNRDAPSWSRIEGFLFLRNRKGEVVVAVISLLRLS